MRIDNPTPTTHATLDPARSQDTALVPMPTRDRHRNPTEHPEDRGEDRTRTLMVDCTYMYLVHAVL
ncbi:hypothetical protein CFAM422_008554 [Trichoderma lentiforme]|uniref:Uncharacterized protein n=1 Tax=Trichoderma lentiforme TaxID=1567552 RepID=A0A9P4XBH3_9HYPO|nr:hypothetical protein CFAM422_008554 [Trichoderma lentiforme]